MWDKCSTRGSQESMNFGIILTNIWHASPDDWLAFSLVEYLQRLRQFPSRLCDDIKYSRPSQLTSRGIGQVGLCPAFGEVDEL